MCLYPHEQWNILKWYKCSLKSLPSLALPELLLLHLLIFSPTSFHLHFGDFVVLLFFFDVLVIVVFIKHPSNIFPIAGFCYCLLIYSSAYCRSCCYFYPVVAAVCMYFAHVITIITLISFISLYFLPTTSEVPWFCFFIFIFFGW